MIRGSGKVAQFPLDGRLVLVDRQTGQVAILNPTARLIWEAHWAGQGVSAISRRLARNYEICETQARRDVSAQIASWDRYRLLGEAEEPSSAAQPGGSSGAASPPKKTLPSSRAFAEHTYSLADASFRIRFATEALEALLHPLFAHLSSGPAKAVRTVFDLARIGNDYVVWRNKEEILRGTLVDDLVAAMWRQVVDLSYQDRDYLTVIHGAAVSTGDQCVVMPAPSRSGKSTLTARLLTLGYGYLGDDVVPLERESLKAVPVPLCLNLKSGGVRVLGKYLRNTRPRCVCQSGERRYLFFSPLDFGARVEYDKCSVTSLVYPRYDPRAATRLQPIPVVDAFQRLIESDSSFDSPLRPDKVKELANWLQRIPAYNLAYSDVDKAADCLLKMLGAIAGRR